MRAFLNLIFFLLILCCGLAGGYLFAKTGYSVPMVSEKLDALVPASIGSNSSTEQLQASLQEQTAIASQLDRALQTLRGDAEKLQAQNAQLVATLNNPVAGATGGSAAIEAQINDLIEQNQFLTDELTNVFTEKSDLEAKIKQLETNPTNATGASDGAATQQITELLAERQQMVQSLTKALKDRDSAEADKRNTQAQFQSVISKFQAAGGDVRGLLNAAGVDMNALAQGQGGAVLQNIVNGLNAQ